MAVLARLARLWLHGAMAPPDELPLRRLTLDDWPARADEPTALIAFLRIREVPRPCALGWLLDEIPVDELSARASSLRRVGRVAAVILAADQLTTARLRGLDRGVPLLIVLTPTQRAPMAAWQAARDQLARLRSATLRFATVGVPLCHLQASHLDLQLRQSPATRDRAATPHACLDCAAVSRCPGPGAVAGARAEVRPLPQPMSNQFDLVERPLLSHSTASPPAETSCPADGQLGDVLLLEHGQFRRFEPDSGGWTATARRHATDQLGQIYLDVSRKARLDDFSKDLIALERHHDPHPTAQGSCPGAWRRRAAQPFAAEERVLLAELAHLRGTIVDVGAGPIRYTATLAPAMAAHQVRYIAVDPDQGVLRHSRTGLPGGIFLRGVGERLPLADGVADGVMLLRSYNHLVDVRQALSEARRILRPGGTLLLVDNVGFGLARTPTQLLRARAQPLSKTQFEHYRDHNADDAVRELRRLGGLRVEAVYPVGPLASNQWLVRACRVQVRPEAGRG